MRAKETEKADGTEEGKIHWKFCKRRHRLEFTLWYLHFASTTKQNTRAHTSTRAPNDTQDDFQANLAIRSLFSHSFEWNTNILHLTEIHFHSFAHIPSLSRNWKFFRSLELSHMPKNVTFCWARHASRLNAKASNISDSIRFRANGEKFGGNNRHCRWRHTATTTAC